MCEFFKRVLRSPLTFALFTMIWCMVIFSFSAENAEQSSATSAQVIEGICEVTVSGYDQLAPIEQQQIVSGMQFEIRKLAHFSLYLILGMLSLMTVKRLQKPAFMTKLPTVTAVVFCALYAGSDEFHQLFSDGRAAQITDVLIDTAGAATGCAILSAVAALYRYIKKRKAA